MHCGHHVAHAAIFDPKTMDIVSSTCSFENSAYYVQASYAWPIGAAGAQEFYTLKVMGTHP